MSVIPIGIICGSHAGYMLMIFIACTLQIFFQAKYLIPDPIANDVKYQAGAQPFLVFGLLTTALCIGHINQIS